MCGGPRGPGVPAETRSIAQAPHASPYARSPSLPAGAWAGCEAGPGLAWMPGSWVVHRYSTLPVPTQPYPNPVLPLPTHPAHAPPETPNTCAYSSFRTVQGDPRGVRTPRARRGCVGLQPPPHASALRPAPQRLLQDPQVYLRYISGISQVISQVNLRLISG